MLVDDIGGWAGEVTSHHTPSDLCTEPDLSLSVGRVSAHTVLTLENHVF